MVSAGRVFRPSVTFASRLPCFLTSGIFRCGGTVGVQQRGHRGLADEASPDCKAHACVGRRDGGPRCLWCGLMGGGWTGGRVLQLCVSRIFDGGSQRRER